LCEDETTLFENRLITSGGGQSMKVEPESWEADVLYAFQGFYNAVTAPEARGVLRKHPVLVSDAGLAFLRRMGSELEDPSARDTLKTGCAVLERYQENWASTERERVFVPPIVFAADVSWLSEATDEFAAGRGSSAELDQAVATWERILNNSAFSESPLCFRLVAFSCASGAYSLRYKAVPRAEDLDRAVALALRAVNSLRPNSPDRADYVNSLSCRLFERYLKTLNLDDLERSIEAAQDLIDHPPPDPRDLADPWNTLGNALMERYLRDPFGADLERAIHAFEQATEAVRSEAQHFKIYLNNLCDTLRELYLRTRSAEHLERSIEIGEKALSASEQDPVWAPRAMTNLANALLDRYDLTGEADDRDLRRATELLKVAAERTSLGSFDRAVTLNGIASTLILRFELTQDVSDLDPGINLTEEAISGTQPHSLEMIAFLYNAGHLFSVRYKKTKASTDRDKAIEYWERAWSLLRRLFVSGPVNYKLGQLHKWIEVHRMIVLAYLEQAEADPPKAIMAKQRAMVLAEGGKSRLLTESVGRAELKAPPVVSKYARRERQLVAELTALDNAELASFDHAAAPGRLERQRRQEECRQKLEHLWELMSRRGAEAEDYVKMRRADELGWDDLCALATELGPDTILISHLITKNRTLLFILRAGWSAPEVVGINVDEPTGAAMLRRLFQELHNVPQDTSAAETWADTLRPLLEKVTTHLHGVTRIVFAPGDSGYLIPWAVVAEQAGWRTAEGRSIPLVTIPALAILPRLRRRRAYKAGRILVVGDPRSDMLYSEVEAREVAGLLRARPLIGNKASKLAVLSRLPKASIAHFATHAYFVAGSPLDSGIRLADDNLTARELISCALKTDLIVLSACETGRAEKLAGDEVAGLVMAALQAGAQALLVSLWPVSGLATAVLTTAFYAAWRKRGDMALALSEAVAEIRAQGWTHPYFWGAFVLFGDWSSTIPDRPFHSDPKS
jgi:CHAT domain-containing protein